MGRVSHGEWRAALELFKEALALDAKEESDISEERADCAYNVACCAARLGDLDEAETWLRRSVQWGVRNVHPESDEDLEALRQDTVERLDRFLTTIEPLSVKQEMAPAAVLERSKRSGAGRGMSALAREMAAEGDWEDEDDEGFEDGDVDQEQDRDVFDSDFDDSEDEEEEDDAREAAPKPKMKKKEAPATNSRRAAAHKAQAINAVAVNNMEDDDDDEDGDFESAEVDAETLEPRGLQSARQAVGEAVRKRKAEEAWKDLDGEAVLGSEAPIVEEKQKSRKRRRVAYAPRKKRSAQAVLSQIFGDEAAAKILARARANIARRAKEAAERPAQPLRVLKTHTVTETKTFAGEKVEIQRTVMAEDAGKKAATTGIDAVLAEIKGPQAVSTVAKSSSDWDAFKTQEGIEDSLRDASKKGYLANQDFLERCDLRAFDRERDDREKQRALRDAAAAAQPP
ncbi:hypothetical protein CTAYLR_004162 [Chrysophaeum taylorii]|uniref:BCNT-C domain-containing protein n=1 Tax=Chrysophaeum taylorii TaxID=2483200 RepID=A0AAD7UL23_9STRA|nr:hypothetical protein CTAYLR_004162 [Chrysophaeum taylorii]